MVCAGPVGDGYTMCRRRVGRDENDRDGMSEIPAPNPILWPDGDFVIPGFMICATCKAESRKSTIAVGLSMSTALGTAEYFDEEGVRHYHDMNHTWTSYRCSNGHEWTLSSEPHTCPVPGCRVGR